MNVGLLYTPVSIYQMTRGALVLFVGTLSVIFLHRRLWLYQYVLSPSPIPYSSLVSTQMGFSFDCHGRYLARRIQRLAYQGCCTLYLASLRVRRVRT